MNRATKTIVSTIGGILEILQGLGLYLLTFVSRFAADIQRNTQGIP